MPVLVIGSNGQLARALRQLLPDAVFLDRSKADLALPDKLAAVLEQYDASAVINAAAYTQVDKAESEEALATAVNADSPGVMARHCARRSIPFVHFSTDYVFGGSGDKPWKEDDATAPLNAYGRSKLAGEKAVAEAGGDHLIFRTAWVYDAEGRNFLNSILRLAGEREELKVIDDQFGAPTYAPHLAAGAVKALLAAKSKPSFPAGVYHLSGGGVTTWHGFAGAILNEAGKHGMKVKAQKILPIPSSEYPLPAPRPRNSRLDCRKALSMFGVALPAWQAGLAECMEKKA